MSIFECRIESGESDQWPVICDQFPEVGKARCGGKLSTEGSEVLSSFPSCTWERNCLRRNAARQGRGRAFQLRFVDGIGQQSWRDNNIPKRSLGTRGQRGKKMGRDSARPSK